jgi:hypothetical protein
MRIIFCQYWPFVSIVVGLLDKSGKFAGAFGLLGIFGHFWAL